MNRSIYPKWLLSYFDDKKVDKAKLSEVSGLDSSYFSTPHNALPLDAYLKLFEWAAEYFSKPHLGLELARSAATDDYGLFGFIATSAETVGELCELSERYQRILMQGETIEYIRDGDFVEARFSVSTGLKDKISQDVEFTLASMVNVMCGAYSVESAPSLVCFTHEEIEPSEDYFDVFGNNVRFNQPSNSIWFSASIMDAPLVTANSTLLNVLKEQANKLLEDVEGHEDFLSYVRFLIGNRISDEGFNAEVLSKDLNMSSRTLHRRLKRENTSFMDIRLELVMDIAKNSLVHDKISVTELAQVLGYSESSAFVRAFKNQQGKSPLQYRKEHSRQ